MADAADSEDSGMAAVLGCDLDTAVSVVAARQEIGGRLQIANINAPGQIVLAGATDDLEWLDEHGKDLGVRRSVRLKVAGAFHSSFMEPAARQLANAFDTLEFSQTRFPIWSNVSAKPHMNDIDSALVDQITMPVRFSDTLLDMRAGGITTFVHVGPGDVTAGLAKRTVDDAEVFIVSTLADIPPVVEALGTM
jgi:[acyl-carrier-protein] S-malonyltransferase